MSSIGETTGMMQATSPNPFEEAQGEILSSAPQHFTLSNPPSLGWWKARFDLNLAAVAFLHHYQSVLGEHPSIDDGVSWQADVASRWQAAAGVTPRQWEGVKGELGDSGGKLLSFRARKFAGRKGTWIRPSDRILAVFGMTLKTYDVVTFLDLRTSWKLSGLKGAAAAQAALKPVSEEELGAVGLWASRGGLARLRCAEHLGELLATYPGETTHA